MDVPQSAAVDLGLLLGGGAVAWYGVRRGDMQGYTLAALGAGIAAYGAGRRAMPPAAVLALEGPITVTRAITIDRPAEEVWRYWNEPANLTTALPRISGIETVSDETSRWTAHLPGLGRVEWQSEIVRDEPGQMIAWRSLPGSTLRNSGRVKFRPAPGGRGTEVLLLLVYKPPFGLLGKAAGWLAKGAVGLEAATGLLRVKQLLETGEIPTIEGQPSGRNREGRNETRRAAS